MKLIAEIKSQPLDQVQLGKGYVGAILDCQKRILISDPQGGFSFFTKAGIMNDTNKIRVHRVIHTDEDLRSLIRNSPDEFFWFEDINEVFSWLGNRA
jgi:hypothetical protein